MKSRTHQQWRELFKQQADGDLSVAAFCKQHSIGQSYFYKRKSDLVAKNDELLLLNTIANNLTIAEVYQSKKSKNGK